VPPNRKPHVAGFPIATQSFIDRQSAEFSQVLISGPGSGIRLAKVQIHALPEICKAHGPIERSGCDDDRRSRRVQRFSAGNVVANQAKQRRKRNLECAADGSQQFARGFLLSALYLREVAQRYPRRTRNLTKRAALRLTQTAELLANHTSQHDGFGRNGHEGN
jgi:hypothetical protein